MTVKKAATLFLFLLPLLLLYGSPKNCLGGRDVRREEGGERGKGHELLLPQPSPIFLSSCCFDGRGRREKRKQKERGKEGRKFQPRCREIIGRQREERGKIASTDDQGFTKWTERKMWAQYLPSWINVFCLHFPLFPGVANTENAKYISYSGKKQKNYAPENRQISWLPSFPSFSRDMS